VTSICLLMPGWGPSNRVGNREQSQSQYLFVSHIQMISVTELVRL